MKLLNAPIENYLGDICPWHDYTQAWVPLFNNYYLEFDRLDNNKNAINAKYVRVLL